MDSDPAGNLVEFLYQIPFLSHPPLAYAWNQHRILLLRGWGFDEPTEIRNWEMVAIKIPDLTILWIIFRLLSLDSRHPEALKTQIIHDLALEGKTDDVVTKIGDLIQVD